MGRPSGTTQKSNFSNVFACTLAAAHSRHLISDKIRSQAGLGPQDADRPSAHLRWALQQMKLRGWTNEDWGQLFAYSDGTPGDGPVCILESVRAPFDSPANLPYESIEQHYIRLALRELGVDPVPVYVSVWNDAQAEFDAIETVMLRAIDVAEEVERGDIPYPFVRSQEALMTLFGITREALDAASAALEVEVESTSEGAVPKPASTPAVDGGGAGLGPITDVTETAESFTAPTDQ